MEAQDDLVAIKQLEDFAGVKHKTGVGGFLEYDNIISGNVLKQEKMMSCGPACIKQLADDFGLGKNLTEETLRKISKTDALGGTGPDNITEALIHVFGRDRLEVKPELCIRTSL